MKNIETDIGQRTKEFALSIIKLYRYLTETARPKEMVMSKQVLRSGTSIGANVREALRAQSRADFASKMNIALKEANETEYWLQLLVESDYVSEDMIKPLLIECNELNKILSSIVKTTIDNINKNK